MAKIHEATDIYQISSTIPREEVFGITNQIRRSSVSIPSNIAEGFGRNRSKEYVRFLEISRGSLYELQTQLQIALNINFLDQCDYDGISVLKHEFKKMLNSLITKINASKFKR